MTGRCSVTNCNALMLRGKSLPELTLYKFPDNVSLRQRWLDAIGIKNLKHNHRTWFICSLHFDEKCFDRNLDKIRLKWDSVPSRLVEDYKENKNREVPSKKRRIQHSDSDDASNEAVDVVPSLSTAVCRVCLASGRRVYSLRALGLAATYSALSGAALLAGGPLPRGACAACALRLRAADRLAESSRRANQLLTRLLGKSCELTLDSIIDDVDRNDPLLVTSTLVAAHLDPDHCDLYIKERDDERIDGEDKEEELINMEAEASKFSLINNDINEEEPEEQVASGVKDAEMLSDKTRQNIQIVKIEATDYFNPDELTDDSMEEQQRLPVPLRSDPAPQPSVLLQRVRPRHQTQISLESKNEMEEINEEEKASQCLTIAEAITQDYLHTDYPTKVSRTTQRSAQHVSANASLTPGSDSPFAHWPILIVPPPSDSRRSFRKRCKVCVREGLKNIKTKYKCKHCDVPLCVECFEQFHV